MISEISTLEQFVRDAARVHGDSFIVVYRGYAAHFTLEARDEALRIVSEWSDNLRDDLLRRCTKRLDRRARRLRFGTLGKDQMENHYLDILMFWAMQRVNTDAAEHQEPR